MPTPQQRRQDRDPTDTGVWLSVLNLSAELTGPENGIGRRRSGNPRAVSDGKNSGPQPVAKDAGHLGFPREWPAGNALQQVPRDLRAFTAEPAF